MKEPDITINGMPCTSAMAAIRVAVENFASDLREGGLGEDEHGKVMTKAPELTRFGNSFSGRMEAV